MKKPPQTPPFRVVTPLKPGLTGLQPARPLGEHGQKLWARVTSEYDVSDVSGIEFLTQACQTLDRAEALAALIAIDGEVIRTRTGIKCHPAVKEELGCRSFVVRTLQRLGLNYEPTRSAAGRPPSAY